jgi:tRNA-splicing ligase RtcB (3'-phosphate/5'-hydroxy nucleic acid ligase)
MPWMQAPTLAGRCLSEVFDMVAKKDLIKIEDWLWEVPQSFRSDMRAPARLYADEHFLANALEDRSIEQLINTATLPGIVGRALAMPDIHQGYGFPIGGVVAVRYPGGVISPGGVGYDINCGVRLLASHLHVDEVRPHLGALISSIYAHVPSGVGSSGGIRLSPEQMDGVLSEGCHWAVGRGYGVPEDLDHLESRGVIDSADYTQVSRRARERGRDQLGTLGSGNHFLELDRVTRIFDAEVADAFGLFEGQLTLQIHSGSRGLGHQVCDDFIHTMQRTAAQYHIELPDRELISAPIDSPEGRSYLGAMASAANFAWANRHIMAHLARQVFDTVLAPFAKNRELFTVYDVAHNIAKIEDHHIDGHKMRVCVHRKGATRAFGPGNPELVPAYRKVGQPVLVPGDMGRASFVLVGTNEAMQASFGSTCHGAGRVLSRSAAKREVRGADLKAELEARGIEVRAGSMSGLAEEAPLAYKDIDGVVNIVDRAGLARRVARLEPLAVMKG